MYKPKLAKDIRCPLEYGLAVFGGKWKSRIICVLAEQPVLRPPRVEYCLSAKGKSVVPILQSICSWSGAYHKEGSEHSLSQCQKCDYHFKLTAAGS